MKKLKKKKDKKSKKNKEEKEVKHQMQDSQEKTKVKKVCIDKDLLKPCFNKHFFQEKNQKPEIRKGPMTKEEWERIEKTRKVKVLPDIDSKRLHYDENKSKVQDEYSFVLTGSPPPPHVRAAYKSFKKPQGF